MATLQNWKDLYSELCNAVENVDGIRWQDLWHNQVSFLETEHPFPTPAVFYGFRSRNIEDQGLNTQKVELQIDVYLFYETFADTYDGSSNQSDAFVFLGLLNDINAVLHGSEGSNYSSMRRISFNPVDTGGVGNLYLQTYSAILIDYSAQRAIADVPANPLNDVVINGYSLD